MIKHTLFEYLEDLKKNNHREWFHANKTRYETVKKSMISLLEKVIPEIEKFDPDIKNLEPKKCLFRINRDVRFSKDKSPYKINFGGFMVKYGKSSGNAGYYIHFEPGNSFIAGGIHMPSGPGLKKIRQEIYYNINEFKGILDEALSPEKFRPFLGDKLKRPPKDFPADFPDIDLLKYKSYGLVHEISDKQCLMPDFDQYLINTFQQMSPMVRFINRGLAM